MLLVIPTIVSPSPRCRAFLQLKRFLCFVLVLLVCGLAWWVTVHYFPVQLDVLHLVMHFKSRRKKAVNFMSWFPQCIVVLLPILFISSIPSIPTTTKINGGKNNQTSKKNIDRHTLVSKANRSNQMGKHKHRLNSWNIYVERTQMNLASTLIHYMSINLQYCTAQDSTVQHGAEKHCTAPHYNAYHDDGKQRHTFSCSLALQTAIYRFTNLTNYISNNLIGQAKNA